MVQPTGVTSFHRYSPEVAQRNRDAKHGIYGTEAEREAEHRRRGEVADKALKQSKEVCKKIAEDRDRQ